MNRWIPLTGHDINALTKQCEEEGTHGIIAIVEAFVSERNPTPDWRNLTHEDVDRMITISEYDHVGDRQIILAVYSILRNYNAQSLEASADADAVAYGQS